MVSSPHCPGPPRWSRRSVSVLTGSSFASTQATGPLGQPELLSPSEIVRREDGPGGGGWRWAVAVVRVPPSAPGQGHLWVWAWPPRPLPPLQLQPSPPPSPAARRAPGPRGFGGGRRKHKPLQGRRVWDSQAGQQWGRRWRLGGRQAPGCPSGPVPGLPDVGWAGCRHTPLAQSLRSAEPLPAGRPQPRAAALCRPPREAA